MPPIMAGLSYQDQILPLLNSAWFSGFVTLLVGTAFTAGVLWFGSWPLLLGAAAGMTVSYVCGKLLPAAWYVPAIVFAVIISFVVESAARKFFRDAHPPD